MPAAVIARVALPASLERIRRRHVAAARDGVPAHATLLFPFFEPGDLGPGVRRRLAAVAAGHEPFEITLTGPRTWPTVVYASPESPAAFLRLQRDLQLAFPEWPLYGGEFESVVPHVTVAERAVAADAAIADDPAWAALPVRATVSRVEVIAAPAGGRWTTVWRVRLTGRMRA